MTEQLIGVATPPLVQAAAFALHGFGPRMDADVEALAVLSAQVDHGTEEAVQMYALHERVAIKFAEAAYLAACSLDMDLDDLATFCRHIGGLSEDWLMERHVQQGSRRAVAEAACFAFDQAFTRRYWQLFLTPGQPAPSLMMQ